MKPVVYHRLAENELVESARFYERRREFLGESFLDAAGETLAKIQTNPEFGQLGKFSTRSWKMKRFPFRVGLSGAARPDLDCCRCPFEPEAELLAGKT
jgi:hypothetical protein